MAVIKRLTCRACRGVSEVDTQAKPKDIPPCPKCGSKDREYGEKWIVHLTLLDENGKKYRYYKAISPLKAEATAHEAEMKVSKARGERQQRDVPYTFEAAAIFFDKWITSKMGDNLLSGGMARSYRSRLNVHLKPYFKGRDVRFLTETDVEEYRTTRRASEKPPKPASLNREIATLKRMTSLLCQRKQIPYNPLAGVSLLKENNKREQVLTREQISALLEECDRVEYCERRKKSFRVYRPHLKMAVLIALHTGLRIDGVLTLKWGEVNWSEGKIIKVVKRGKLVRIPITPVLHDALLAWRDSQKVIKSYVIPSPKKPDSHILITSNFGFQRACAAVGITDFTFHQLRHQFATYFIAQTADIPLAAKILGDTPEVVSARYHHLVESEAEAAMKNFTI